MAFEVKKAKRQRRPLKIGLEGLSGSGKTFSALRMAFAMRRAGIGKRIVVADSENESAGLYDGILIDGEKWEYDVCPLPHEAQNPKGYTDCYVYLVEQGYDIIIMDSMTHAWKGALSKVDDLGAKNKGDKFGAGWRVVTPEQEKMMRVLTDGRAHLIATTRVKGEYERVEGSNGKDKIKKVGFKADQRDGMEYEYDCVVRLDPDGHHAVVEKVRGCTEMDGRHAGNPGPEFWKPLFDWWLSAEAVMVDPIGDARRNLAAAADMPALGKVWATLPPEVQKLVLADKDRRKAELSATAVATPSATTATPPTVHEEGLDDLRDVLDAAIMRVPGRTLADVVKQHAKVIGWVPGSPMPSMNQLTGDQVNRLLTILDVEQTANS